MPRQRDEARTPTIVELISVFLAKYYFFFRNIEFGHHWPNGLTLPKIRPEILRQRKHTCTHYGRLAEASIIFANKTEHFVTATKGH